jgi:hypothetical protein
VQAPRQEPLGLHAQLHELRSGAPRQSASNAPRHIQRVGLPGTTPQPLDSGDARGTCSSVVRFRHTLPAEDELLLECVRRYTEQFPGQTDPLSWDVSLWREVSAQLGSTLGVTRTVKQCRERYSNQLDPRLRDDPWTAEEHRELARLRAIHGNQWLLIAAGMPGR